MLKPYVCLIDWIHNEFQRRSFVAIFVKIGLSQHKQWLQHKGYQSNYHFVQSVTIQLVTILLISAPKPDIEQCFKKYLLLGSSVMLDPIGVYQNKGGRMIKRIIVAFHSCNGAIKQKGISFWKHGGTCNGWNMEEIVKEDMVQLWRHGPFVGMNLLRSVLLVPESPFMETSLFEFVLLTLNAFHSETPLGLVLR